MAYHRLPVPSQHCTIHRLFPVCSARLHMHEGQGLNHFSSCQSSQYRYARGWISSPALENGQSVQPWKITPCTSIRLLCCPWLSDGSCCWLLRLFCQKELHTTTPEGFFSYNSTTSHSQIYESSNIMKRQRRGPETIAPTKHISA